MSAILRKTAMVILVNYIILLCPINVFMCDGVGTISNAVAANHISSEKVANSDKSKSITILLALFSGLHQFYLGNNKTAVVYIAINLLFGLGALLSLADCVALIMMTDDEFHKMVNEGDPLFAVHYFSRL